MRLCSTAAACSTAAFTNPRLFKGEFEPQIGVAVDVASVQLFGYKYTDYAPTADAFQQESQKRIRELYMYCLLYTSEKTAPAMHCALLSFRVM